MEVVRQFIDAKKLMSVMTLPRSLQNSRVEVIVLPAEGETADNRMRAKKKLEVDSIVDSLVGILPDDGKSLDDSITPTNFHKQDKMLLETEHNVCYNTSQCCLM